MTRGRTELPRSAPEIAADALQTAARMRSDADRMRDLGAQAAQAIERAADTAMETGAKILGQALEGIAEQVHGKIDEFFGSFRIVADDAGTPRRPTPAAPKALKP